MENFDDANHTFESGTHEQFTAQKPVRKVVTRSPHRSVGTIACSWIQDSVVEYESQLEKRFVHRLLLFHGLARITHQPFKLERDVAGKKLDYTPDFLVMLKNGNRGKKNVQAAQKFGALTSSQSLKIRSQDDAIPAHAEVLVTPDEFASSRREIPIFESINLD